MYYPDNHKVENYPHQSSITLKYSSFSANYYYKLGFADSIIIDKKRRGFR